MSQGHQIVRLRPGSSDGDALHVPKQGKHSQLNPPTLYLEKIAQQWMEHRGEAEPGVKYKLESLPYGYTLWHRPRAGKPTSYDKYLYGHPSQKYFDSPNRYFPHFLHLMENNGNNIGCPCTICAGSAGILPSTKSSVSRSSSSASSHVQTHTGKTAKVQPVPMPMPIRRMPVTGTSAPTKHFSSPAAQPTSASALSTQPKGRPKLIATGMDNTHVDDEGTPDVYRNLIDRLKRHGTIDEMVQQPLSADWRAEQKVLPSMLKSLKQQGHWLPRVGEIVLYLRDLPHEVEIVRHDTTGEFQMYHQEAGEFLGTPSWQAGLVGEVPDKSTSISIADLHRSNSETSVIYCGIRVEPLPNVNESDKSISKRHRYVSLRQVRPFVFWRELLAQVPEDEWHATITNALISSATLSLIGKYRFRGTWPEAAIYCHGIYLGSELLVVGDAVRLLPNASKFQTRCTEIMVIKTIRLKWSSLDLASSNDYDEGRPYNSEVLIYGSAYTSDLSAINKEYISEDNTMPPSAAAPYSEWYPLHPSSKELVIPYSRIAGRLYEQDAVSFWLGSDSANRPDPDRPDPDLGREGVVEARAFARQHDERIRREPGATWYWGDDRADALSLHTINGIEVSRHNQERDVRTLRKNIKILDSLKAAKPELMTTFNNRDLRSFMAPRSALATESSPSVAELGMSNSSPSKSFNTAGSSTAIKKRCHVVVLSDDEDEIKEHTRLVEEIPRQKKAKVAVLVKGK
ncbi:hypothetical protein ACEQ8H_002322 [Pleosporales sp. CAS-2024a]